MNTGLLDCALTLKTVHVLYRLRTNKTRQGYARKRNLKPAGYFFVDEARQ